MFYGQFILSKKGPLAKVWLAAHIERKLSRQMVFDTDVAAVVEEVIRPKVKISLRTNGHLMLGIVRIYSKKAEFVLHDLERAKKIFHHFVEKERQRRVHRARREGSTAIDTIAEEDENENEMDVPNIRDFEFPPGPEFNASMQNADITLHEDDLFAPIDMTYLDGIFDPEVNENLDSLLDDNLEQMRLSRAGTEDRDFNSLNGDPFAALIDMNHHGHNSSEFENARHSNQAFNDLQDFDEPMDLGPQVVPFDIVGCENDESSTSVSKIALDPLTDSQIRQNLEEARQTRRRVRNRALIADDRITLEDDEIRDRMENIDDIVNPISFAPPTKDLMNAKLFGSVNYIFDHPATNMAINSNFMKLYSEHCVLQSRQPADVPTAEDVRKSMGMSQEAQLDANERVPTRNTNNSRASSIPLDQRHQFQDDMYPINMDEAFGINDSLTHTTALIQTNITTRPANFFNETESSIATELQQDLFEDQLIGEERENVNPFAGPPPKRSRNEFELKEEEERRQRYTKELMRQIKTEVANSGNQTIEFDDIVIPKTVNKNEILQLPNKERRELAKRVAHQFYALLELRKTHTIEVEQNGAYEPIFVTVLP